MRIRSEVERRLNGEVRLFAGFAWRTMMEGRPRPRRRVWCSWNGGLAKDSRLVSTMGIYYMIGRK